ncbi:hypothetical protein D3C76_1482700 [compost metagenome]
MMQGDSLSRLRLNRTAPFAQIMMRQYEMLKRQHLLRLQIHASADGRFCNPVRSHGNMADQLALHTVVGDNAEA